MALTPTRERSNYISISSDAKLRKEVTLDTPGAVERTYETKEKDTEGNFIKATKIEKLYESVSGRITNITFLTTKIGTLLQITVSDLFLNDEEVLSINTSSSFTQDFMTKLPNIDLSKDVILKPYAFTPEGKKKELKGITVTQDNKKIEKSFREKTGVNKDGHDVYKKTMGMPSPDEKLEKETNDMKRTEGWKRYYKDVEIFLVDYTTEHFATKKEETVASVSDDMNDVSKDF